MSDDKKRDRALQRRVRERQAKTGESYQAAWRHLANNEAADLASGEAPSSSSTSSARNQRRVPLSLGTGPDVKVLPGQSAQITARPQLESFWPDRILIKDADHWDVHELFVGNWSDPEFYSKRSLLEAGPRKASSFALDTWHPITEQEVRCGQAIVAVVTYTGPNEQGACFEAVAFGWEGRPPTKSTKNHEANDRISERAESSRRVSVNETIELPLIVTSPVLFADRLTIKDAKNWVVNDVQTRGKSIFVQAGDLPGEMFSDSSHVILEPLAAGDRVRVVATYVGSKATASLAIELSGTPEPPSAPRAISYFLPLSTGVSRAILPNQSAQITARSQQERDFLPERLVIAEADDWIINNIMIGIQCQLAAIGEIPGQAFSSRTVGGHVTLDPARTAQEFVVVTTRGEDCKKSAAFFCGAQGRLV